uniref:Uncharacterized protein n=1 Tax=Ralstonia solanacearum TaxID=305 RepID=A0A0S4U130_RALSL|nr:protein of unknown function [Ralstonia solanacearum]
MTRSTLIGLRFANKTASSPSGVAHCFEHGPKNDHQRVVEGSPAAAADSGASSQRRSASLNGILFVLQPSIPWAEVHGVQRCKTQGEEEATCVTAFQRGGVAGVCRRAVVGIRGEELRVLWRRE